MIRWRQLEKGQSRAYSGREQATVHPPIDPRGRWERHSPARCEPFGASVLLDERYVDPSHPGKRFSSSAERRGDAPRPAA